MKIILNLICLIPLAVASLSTPGGEMNSTNSEELLSNKTDALMLRKSNEREPGGARLYPKILELFPACHEFGTAMRMKKREMVKAGKLGPSVCEQDLQLCWMNDVKVVRCKVQENPPQECLNQITAYVKGEICRGRKEENEMEDDEEENMEKDKKEGTKMFDEVTEVTMQDDMEKKDRKNEAKKKNDKRKEDEKKNE
ncbi:hypothetical protein CDAR_67391 [Caerostris darwini]|uniref:Uncharacterized protein n=1 Tax=Caerostris darwini TaxID=1538125 RepID=A0AAV4U8E7_9ARAC|nr:hypothetical protein CDAR_67391 [Caerostris darwini]